MVKTQTLSFGTHGNGDCQDITGGLARLTAECGIKHGTVTVFCPSATSAITTIEFEAGAIADLRRLFDEIVPPPKQYAHNDRWGDGNGHSHVRAALLGPSLTIPIIEGQLALGTWQQVVHIDFDVRPRQRELIVQVMGD